MTNTLTRHATTPPTPMPYTGARADTRQSPLRNFDPFLFLAPAAISGLGLLMIYSSTRTRLASEHVSALYYVERQGIALVIGLVAMVVLSSIDYRRLRDWWSVMLALTLPVLAAVRFLGTGRNSTTAWFQVGPLQFQPSEVAKLVVVFALAGYCHRHRGDLDAWRLAVSLAIAAVPMGLVMLQNDLGTMLVLAVCTIAVLVVAGLRPLHLGVLALVGVTLVGALVVAGEFDGYRLDRLTSFLDQGKVDTQTASPAQYNLQQSKDAIRNGQVRGRGLFNGTLTKLSYVPAQHTDFIFTVVGEELGFIGGVGLLFLYALTVWRTWRAALTAGDFFGTLVCVGVLAMFTFQVFENMGMTMGIMPITGIPLPFMSYGGSAMIAYWAAIGLVQNVHMRRFA